MVMQALVQSEGLSLKQLSAQVSLAQSTVSGIVDRLQARGMVVRSVRKLEERAEVSAREQQQAFLLCIRARLQSCHLPAKKVRALAPATAKSARIFEWQNAPGLKPDSFFSPFRHD
jgi:DNA-binding MarR family transcriptional regulator